MLKNGGNRIVDVLCSLVNLVMEFKCWPDDWRWSVNDVVCSEGLQIIITEEQGELGQG